MTARPDQEAKAGRAGCPACWHTGRRFPFCEPTSLAYLQPCPACAGSTEERKTVTVNSDPADFPPPALLRFLLYIPIVFVGTLLAFPLVPLGVWFADELGRLPRPLRWLETHDAPGWAGPATEEATMRTSRRWGLRAGLVHYLWRNKAYTLRHSLRARLSEDMPRQQSGKKVPARIGYSQWFGQIGPYFEWQPRFGVGSFHLYLRVGWKLKPIFDAGLWPQGKTSVGMFSGISPRIDDWDDYGPEDRSTYRGQMEILPFAIVGGLLLWLVLAEVMTWPKG